MDVFVYREMKTGEMTFYEIGECRYPRLFPSMWCDKRVCEGFWGDEAQAKETTAAMNAALHNAGVTGAEPQAERPR